MSKGHDEVLASDHGDGMNRGHDDGPTRLYDDARLASAYQQGNVMPDGSLRAWVRLIGSFSPAADPVVLDMGAGTGMFCVAMARWLPARAVLGIDASAPMLSRATKAATGPRVRYAAGLAESIPARKHTFDLALLSRVVHHLPDRRACAAELGRVLRPGGTVVIRTTFSGSLDAPVYRYWPSLLEIDRERFPGRDELIGDFVAAGFTMSRLTSLAQPVTSSLREYHTRMATRPQSKFGYLTEAEFGHGLRRLQEAASAEPASRPTPVSERYDVLALTAG